MKSYAASGGLRQILRYRLGRYFGLSATYWMNLQAIYEIEVAEDLLEDRLEREVAPRGDVAA